MKLLVYKKLFSLANEMDNIFSFTSNMLGATHLKAKTLDASDRFIMMKVFFCMGLLFTLSSCTYTYHFTYTKKSGIEQLLITKAVDDALQGLALDTKGSTVFVEVACLMRDEKSYIRKALTHRLLENGISVTEYRWEADYIVSVLVRVAGTDGTESLFGLPSFPTPLANITTPSINVVSGIVQKGRVEMEVIVYSSKTGLKEKIPSLTGSSYFKKYIILFIPLSKKDIP
jgi:hypothetical protein